VGADAGACHFFVNRTPPSARRCARRRKMPRRPGLNGGRRRTRVIVTGVSFSGPALGRGGGAESLASTTIYTSFIIGYTAGPARVSTAAVAGAGSASIPGAMVGGHLDRGWIETLGAAQLNRGALDRCDHLFSILVLVLVVRADRNCSGRVTPTENREKTQSGIRTLLPIGTSGRAFRPSFQRAGAPRLGVLLVTAAALLFPPGQTGTMPISIRRQNALAFAALAPLAPPSTSSSALLLASWISATLRSLCHRRLRPYGGRQLVAGPARRGGGFWEPLPMARPSSAVFNTAGRRRRFISRSRFWLMLPVASPRSPAFFRRVVRRAHAAAQKAIYLANRDPRVLARSCQLSAPQTRRRLPMARMGPQRASLRHGSSATISELTRPPYYYVGPRLSSPF